jgi:hypothetical protein
MIYPFKLDLPYGIKGFSFCDQDGNTIILLNSRMNYEANLQTYLHELDHEKDFNNPNIDNVSELESLRHA